MLVYLLCDNALTESLVRTQLNSFTLGMWDRFIKFMRCYDTKDVTVLNQH